MAVTPTGSEPDLRFTRGWQLLAADPGLLAAYNALKVAEEGAYEARKSAFFDRLVRIRPTHPAAVPNERDGGVGRS